MELRVAMSLKQALGVWKSGAVRDSYERFWLRPENAALKAAREVRCQFNLKDKQALDLLLEFPAADHTNAARKMAGIVGGSPKPELSLEEHVFEQIAWLVQGQLQAIAAVAELPHQLDLSVRGSEHSLSPAFVKHASLAVKRYQQAWPLLLDPLFRTREAAMSATNGLSSNPASLGAQALSLLACHPDFTGHADLTASSWLTVERLINWLLQQPDSVDEAASTESRILLTSEIPGSTEWIGTRREVKFQAIGGILGFYLDPVTTGITCIEPHMVRSLQRAWTVAVVDLHRRQAAAFPVPKAIRICPDTSGLLALNGESAGGLFACGLLAVARGWKLNQRASASFVLNDDLSIGPVSEESLLSKLKHAADPKDPLDLVVVADSQKLKVGDTTYQFQAWSQKDRRPELGRLEIRGIKTVDEALEWLTTDHQKEEILRAYCAECVRIWDERIPDNHRPDPFIEPHYAVVAEHMIEATQRDEARLRGEVLEAAQPEPLLSDEDRKSIRYGADHQREVGDREIQLLIEKAQEHARLYRNDQDNPAGARLILAEDANAGKTVFTKRLLRFFASEFGQRAFFDGQPVLVVRFENRSDQSAWPEGANDEVAKAELLKALRKECERRLKPSKSLTQKELDEVVAYALEQGRVVVILDAADQSRDPVALIQMLTTDPDFLRCPVIVTGRSFAFSDGFKFAKSDRLQTGSNLFQREAWLRSTILGFDDNQKARFLNDVLPEPRGATAAAETPLAPELQGEEPEVTGNDEPVDTSSFKQLFESYDDVAELLSVPGMLMMARGLILEERKAHGASFQKLTQLRTRFDFYWQYYIRAVVAEAVRDRSLHLDYDRDGERWELMLATTAFRMVLGRRTDFTVRGDELKQIKKDVIKYCVKYLAEEDALKDWKADDEPEKHWRKLLSFSALSDHSITEERPDHRDVLSWRHKGWMEAWCAVFLAKYARPECLIEFDWDALKPLRDVSDELYEQLKTQPGFIEMKCSAYQLLEPGEQDRFMADVLAQITNDPQWYWAWQMASEIPRVTADSVPYRPKELCRSLGALFRLPAREIRPNELLYYAFYLFEEDDATPGFWRGYTRRLDSELKQQVLTEFRESMREVREQIEPRENAPADDIYRCRPCPPLHLVAQFMDETEAGFKTKSVVWGHRYERDDGYYEQYVVEPFFLQPAMVTLNQYLVFDPQFKNYLAREARQFEMQQAKIEYEEPLERRIRRHLKTFHFGGIVSESVSREITEIKTYISQLERSSSSNCSVRRVSWFDSLMFAKSIGEDYRLPFECEWEFAGCEGREVARLYYGSNHYDRHSSISFGYRNNWGLREMENDVWEWCLDWSQDLTDANGTLVPTTNRAFRKILGGDGGFRKLGPFNHQGMRMPLSREWDCGFRVICIR